MFLDSNNVDYKLGCKFDFKFGTEESDLPSMAYRVSTRLPHQWRIEENHEFPGKDFLDANEVRRERVWKDFSQNLLDIGTSPREFLQNSFTHKFMQPKCKVT